MKKLFAVDDDVSMLQMMAKALQPYDYSLTWSGGAIGSMEKIHAAAPEAVILDVMLPDGGGYQIARAIRADAQLYKLPILFASAMADAPEVEYALKQGGDSYLMKPFSLKELLDKLQALEELSARIGRVHPDTGLPALEALGRELDHKIFRKDAFSLCYMAFDNFDPFMAAKGNGEGLKLVRWFSNALQATVKRLNLKEAQLGYLGRDYFLAIVDTNHCDAFCEAISAEFEEGVRQFYRKEEVDGCHIVASVNSGVMTSYPLMMLHVAVAAHENGNYSSSHDILQHLQQSMKHRDAKPEHGLYKWKRKKRVQA